MQPVPTNTNAPQPLLPGQQPPMVPTPEPQQPHNKYKVMTAIALVVLMLTAAVGIMFFMSPKKAAQEEVPAVSSTPINTLSAKQVLTEEDLRALDSTNAFWAYFKQAAQQSVLTTTKEYYYANSPTAKPTSVTIKRTGFDYTTKKIVQAVDMPDDILNGRLKYRCYDGKEYFLTPTTSYGWREVEADDATYCNLDKESADINDGMNTGGLTAGQAESFIQTLRRQDGLVTVDSLQIAEKHGKQYLHFEVTLAPQPTNEENIYMGNQWWMWAFKKTGLDPSTQPYGYIGAGGEGMKITYYVDPATKLPVYSVVRTTPLKDKNGKDKPVENYAHYRTEYAFGSMPDVQTANEQDINLVWR